MDPDDCVATNFRFRSVEAYLVHSFPEVAPVFVVELRHACGEFGQSFCENGTKALQELSESSGNVEVEAPMPMLFLYLQISAATIKGVTI